MKLLFFAPYTKRNTRQIHLLIDMLSTVNDLEVYGAVESLYRRLSLPVDVDCLVVLFVTDVKSLLKIVAMKELLSGLRIILVLPDRRPETIAKGHLLRPRFMTYADTDTEEIAAVLNKMLRRLTSATVSQGGGSGQPG